MAAFVACSGNSACTESGFMTTMCLFSGAPRAREAPTSCAAICERGDLPVQWCEGAAALGPRPAWGRATVKQRAAL